MVIKNSKGENMADCLNCGIQLVEGSNFCNDCGAPVKSEKIKPKRMSTTFIVIITAISTVFLIIGSISFIAVPKMQEVLRNSSERSAIDYLLEFATDQETYKADNAIYGTIEKIALEEKIDLRNSSNGYTFVNIFKEPNFDFYAVLASPINWGISGKSHYIITSEGEVKVCKEKELPFELSLPATQNSVDIINKLKNAR